MGSTNSDKDKDGKEGFFDPTFRNELEAIFPYILNTPDVLNVATAPLTLSRADMVRADNDFYQITARSAKLDRCYWWVMLRLNGYSHPNQFKSAELTETVLIPIPSYFDALLLQYLTVKSVKI